MTHQYTDQEQKIHATVLIVDDISENLQLLGKILDDHDIEFTYATSGKDALESISYAKPDLILLDVNMPEMTGYEVCEILKKDSATRDIPVIFLTAKSDPEDVLRGLNAGGIDYITKPFNAREMISRVRSHLELSISKQIMAFQNEKLTKLNTELRDTIASKDKFFNIIAHDLKDPFNTLIGFSDFLLKTSEVSSPEEIRTIVKHIYESSVSGFELLNNLLEWSRSQTGSLKIHPEHLELSEIAHRVIDLMANTADKKQINISVTALEDQMVWADRKMVETILRNLVSNALKFTSAGGTVKIGYQKIDEGKVGISVKDTGTGMSNEHIQKLFNLEENISKPGTDNEHGTGLGLVLCKEFTILNGGEIGVESEPGAGSEFTITLPVKNE